jgi:hypothetical protein
MSTRKRSSALLFSALCSSWQWLLPASDKLTVEELWAKSAILGGWQVGGITTVQSGEAVTASMSSDFSNTDSFSYRPDQIGDPYNFSLNTASQGTDFGCTNPGHQTLDCWFNQTVFVTLPLAPGQQFSPEFGNARIGNLRGPDWSSSILYCRRTSRFASHSKSSFARSSSMCSIIQTSVCLVADHRSRLMNQAASPSSTPQLTIARSSLRSSTRFRSSLICTEMAKTRLLLS